MSKTANFVTLTCDQLLEGANKLRFGDKPLGSSDSSRPRNVAIHWEDVYQWFLTLPGVAPRKHPSTGDMVTYCEDLPANNPFGMSTEMRKKDPKAPNDRTKDTVTPLDPKFDLVIRGNQMKLIEAVAAIEEAVIQDYVNRFEKLNPEEYAKLKKLNKNKDPSREDIERDVRRMFKSCIKDLKTKNDMGEVVVDTTGNVFSAKVRVPDNFKKNGSGDSKAAASKVTDFREAKLDTFGFVMHPEKDTVLRIEDVIQNQKFKGMSLSIVLQPSCYWYNQTGIGVKFFLKRVRVIPRRVAGGAAGAEELPDFGDLTIGRTAEEAPKAEADTGAEAAGAHESDAEEASAPASTPASESDDAMTESENESESDDE